MKEFFQMMRRFVSPYKKYLGWAVLLNLLSAVFNIFSFTLLIPILQILFKIDQRTYSFIPWNSDMGIKEVAINNFYYSVSQMIESYGSSNSLLFLGLFLAFMTMLKTSCYFASSAVMIPLRTGVVRDIRIMVYSKVMRLPLRFFSEERKGDIIARMSGDVGEVENSITSSLDMLIKNPILIVMYFGTLLATSWQLTLFTFLVVPGMGWVMGKVGKKLKRQSLEAQGKWSDTMTQLEETLGGLRIIKAFIAEQKMIDRFTQCSNELRDATNRVATRQALAHPMSEFLGTLLIVLVLWFGGSLILGEQSSIDAPTFIFYMVILYSVINPLKEFSKAGYNIPKGLASMERVDKILKAENPIKEIANPKVLDNLNDKIELKNISFSYDGTHQVLKNINITIPKGKTIALVGQSGSGKSTLVDLLPRYHDIQEGEILIDGINIKELRIANLRSLIGNVNQEAILFNDSFFNNIAFGVENATLEQVIAAAKIANAHDFIMETEKGYDTNIGDRGGKLSGGQRQRVSIARAILKNPPILILDEATSALDTESERLVQEALERLMKTRTTIAIAHRLSTIKNADEICVLYEGKIVERGKHDELLAKNGYYKRLNDMQSLA
ncbi:ABC transporter ATP-binding protein/permease [Phocaeicola vulgatus]|jgi:ATP-binding cassette subfamily B protein/subfamily B ATP-binding cassette protein MsbA|uniref:ABC transporter ATP-binding protein n=1 Tax=Phocaeicola vulgatus TaxID=821 RepID=A0A415DKV4_PHOVU|nr:MULTISPECIES: ABC transporter ATP-binding protein [Bacteroidaceae]MCE9088211.1 ABC transporter ATP-binding protein/permease [Phocaeicola vulgatus]MCG0153369.1 ABC transporter ATP-binding protein/permease [Phocaeicola vulgatus]MCG0327309.1 ABC transporter ATP-binding protein/permease [Phocaeicola vulgatus]MCG0331186.1 ABC transporter ATP-binding protein/permease [Phocaeicola vulgatus]MCS2666610.1 ABC transporter ATP-binding protein/permease [Phocaeicola vulgatus]